MKLTKWSYTKRYNIKAQFDVFPNSVVLFRQIKEYYFVYTVNWSLKDPVVSKSELAEMERLLNKELGTLESYRQRKYFHNHSE
ncbi:MULTISPECIES: hypothetical protein [unclassified Bacillus (in: firmicutes)]|uniref:hypothetical protein n=1 Tax=unclassified Bacillus (in: firmicutes) TaxID=185979 RepID=UPI001BE66C02|nr:MULTISPECIES: hypothetical protein [unclassified Bacillus (in: firmicutes)]MBT2639408.1 hypothetical protein [Bacillus sp. ISL-39]MBT2662593.1 hypothetical protein [Bacillus sp. ISL-45]